MWGTVYRHAGFITLMLLLPAPVTAVDCNSLEQQQHMLNAQALQLLKEKGTTIPEECVAEMTAFNFPTEILEIKQPQRAKRAVYEILTGFFSIFSSNLVQTGWATTIQARFLNAIYTQSERIKSCFAEGKNEPRGAAERLTKLRLLRYLRRIRTFLQEKKHSACTWTLVQLEARSSLVYLDRLTKEMNS